MRRPRAEPVAHLHLDLVRAHLEERTERGRAQAAASRALGEKPRLRVVKPPRVRQVTVGPVRVGRRNAEERRTAGRQVERRRVRLRRPRGDHRRSVRTVVRRDAPHQSHVPRGVGDHNAYRIRAYPGNNKKHGRGRVGYGPHLAPVEKPRKRKVLILDRIARPHPELYHLPRAQINTVEFRRRPVLNVWKRRRLAHKNIKIPAAHHDVQVPVAVKVGEFRLLPSHRSGLAFVVRQF